MYNKSQVGVTISHSSFTFHSWRHPPSPNSDLSENLACFKTNLSGKLLTNVLKFALSRNKAPKFNLSIAFIELKFNLEEI